MSKNPKDVFKYFMTINQRFVGKFELPLINKSTNIPKNLVSFNYVNSLLKKKSIDPREYYVHFFIDDYQFERIWNRPDRYLSQLSKFAGIIMPDFSVYNNFPFPLQLFNVYKSRLIAAYYKSRGVDVIPTLTWSDESSLKWILDGLPKESVVAVSSNGCLNKLTINEFVRIYKVVIEKLKPVKVVFVGKVPEALKADTRIIEFESHLQKLRGRV